MNNSVMKKTLSVLLAGLMCLPALGGMSASAAGNSSVSASVSGVVTSEMHDLKYEKTVLDNGDGTYTLVLSGQSMYGDLNRTYNRKMIESGYYVAEHDGDYIVQLWGGKGGDGIDYDGLFVDKQGGVGGASGYVEATLSLQAGQVIAYSIGTNGTTTKHSDDGGKSDESEGGSHGKLGSWSVGSGGGHSTVYLFDSEADYLAAKSAGTMNENYALIAGAGGGGAAFSLLQKRPGNGGNGGNSLTSLSGTVAAEYNNGIPGTYYAGDNGTSNTYNDSYIGIGATDVPGTKAKYRIGFFSSGDGNDRSGLYNPDAEPGAGGAGNGRGGGGGGGFAGGSGAAQKDLLDGEAAGGGGGGSSFIAASPYTQNGLDIAITPVANSAELSKSNPNSTGGYIQITPVQDDEEVAAANLETANVTGTISDYFDIVHTSDNVTVSGQNFSVVADVRPEDNRRKVFDKIEITVKPKDDFMGGNNVPLLSGTINIDADDDPALPAFHFVLPANPVSDNVNVPFKHTISTYTVSINEGDSAMVADLYDPIPYTADGVFVSSISAVSVAGVSTATLSPAETTDYKVSYTVTPANNGTATVGKVNANPTTISGKAAIVVCPKGTVRVDGSKILVQKALAEHGDGTYDFTVSLDCSDYGTTYENISAKLLSIGGTTYTVPKDGYYYIIARGGNGGHGGDGRTEDGRYNAEGGAGGAGSVVTQFVYLTKGTVITYEVGANGADGTTNAKTYSKSGGIGVTWYFAAGTGGVGGKATSVRINGADLLVAAGGGGGGAASARSSGSDGTTKGTNYNKKDATANSSRTAYDGANGGDASYNTTRGVWWVDDDAKNGIGGEAGRSYTDTSKNASAPAWVSGLPMYTTAASDTLTESGVKIYEFNSDEVVTYPMKGVQMSGEFSKYFTVNSVSDANVTYSVTGNGTTTFTKADVAPSSENQYTVTFNLSPKAGFIGGNDVPLLVYDGTCETGLKFSRTGKTAATADDLGNADKNPQTDFANVAIDFDLTTGITPLPQTVLHGTTIAADELCDIDIDFPTDWRADYAQFTLTVTDTDGNVIGASVTPDVPTIYTVKAEVEPKYNGEKAVVVTPVSAKTVSKNIAIDVQYPVSYNLTNMTATNTDLADYHDAYRTVLECPGYVMPTAIQITVGGRTLTADLDYTFDTKDGIAAIADGVIDGDVVITAAAAPETYTITWNAYDKDDTSVLDTYTLTYEAGEAIDFTWANNYRISANETAPTGYEFVWEYQGGTSSVMPASNLFADGHYVKKQYTLTIEYYKDGVKFDEVSGPVSFGTDYSRVSEEIEGYLCDTPIVSGTMPEHDATVVVTYTPLPADTYTVTITLVDNESKDTIDVIVETVTDGDSFNFDMTDKVPGYTPDIAAVSGTMNGANLSYTVTYSEILTEHVVNFNANGGTASYTSNTYYLEKPYGYIGLPSAVRAAEGTTRYEFDGWYTAAVGGERVTGETMTDAGVTTLYAHWNALSTTITFDANGGAFADSSLTKTAVGTYNAVYPIIADVPTRNGYAFTGWYTSKDGEGKITDTTVFAFTSARTLYAGWEMTDSTTIIFKSGDAVLAKITPEIAESYMVDLIAAPANGGYFKGWECDANAKVYTLDQTKKVTITDDSGDAPLTVTFTAQYYDTAAIDNTVITGAKAQRVILTNKTGNYIRVISVMSTDNYNAETETWPYIAAGFVVAANGANATPTIEAGMQYNTITKIYGKVMTNGEYVESKDLGTRFGFANAQGLFYVNLKAANTSTTFSVTPYVKFNDGTYQYGETRTVSYAELTELDHASGIYLANEQ